LDNQNYRINETMNATLDEEPADISEENNKSAPAGDSEGSDDEQESQNKVD